MEVSGRQNAALQFFGGEFRCSRTFGWSDRPKRQGQVLINRALDWILGVKFDGGLEESVELQTLELVPHGGVGWGVFSNSNNESSGLELENCLAGRCMSLVQTVYDNRSRQTGKINTLRHGNTQQLGR